MGEEIGGESIVELVESKVVIARVVESQAVICQAIIGQVVISQVVRSKVVRSQVVISQVVGSRVVGSWVVESKAVIRIVVRLKVVQSCLTDLSSVDMVLLGSVLPRLDVCLGSYYSQQAAVSLQQGRKYIYSLAFYNSYKFVLQCKLVLCG